MRGHRFRRHLGQAARHHQQAIRVEALGRVDLVAARAVALGRDSAGVDHADVGRLLPVHQTKARGRQGFLHLSGLTLVQPAADGAKGHGVTAGF